MLNLFKLFSKKNELDWSKNEITAFGKCLISLAKSDGNFDEEEKEFLKKVLIETGFKFKNRFSIDDLVDEVYYWSIEKAASCLKNATNDKKVFLLSSLWKMAEADGHLSKTEDDFINSFSEMIGLNKIYQNNDELDLSKQIQDLLTKYCTIFNLSADDVTDQLNVLNEVIPLIEKAQKPLFESILSQGKDLSYGIVTYMDPDFTYNYTLPELLYYSGTLKLKIKDESCITDFERSIEIIEEENVLTNLAIAYTNLHQDFDKAITILDKCVEIDPENERTIELRNKLIEARNSVSDDKLKNQSESIPVEEDDKITVQKTITIIVDHFNKGEEYLHAQDYENALSKFTVSYKLFEILDEFDFPTIKLENNVFVDLVTISHKMGICFLFLDDDRCIEFFTKSFEIDKKEPNFDAIYMRAASYLKFQKINEAEKDIEFYLSKNPNDKAGQKLKSAIDQLKK